MELGPGQKHALPKRLTPKDASSLDKAHAGALWNEKVHVRDQERRRYPRKKSEKVQIQF